MGKFLRSNESEERHDDSEQRASVFARQVLARVGGSCVYIAPKNKKLVDLEPIE